MPLAKIHVVEGRYDEDRIAKVSGAVQAALMNTLRVPPEDFYQLIFEFPKKRSPHTVVCRHALYRRPDYPRSHFHRRAVEGDAARTLERRQHPRRRGGRRVAGRPDDHALRSPLREFLVRPGRGAARQRRAARATIARLLIVAASAVGWAKAATIVM